MFGHLRPEDFMIAIDGGSLSAQGQSHVESCTSCMAKLRSIEAAHAALSSDDCDIPEPDWNEFRDSVRSELLSRSIQRESAVRRWTGWPIRPAMAWAFSFLLLICLSAGFFYWHLSHDATTATLVETPADISDDEAEDTAWTNTSVFEELSTMEEPQAERLRLLIEESAQKGTLNQQ